MTNTYAQNLQAWTQEQLKTRSLAQFASELSNAANVPKPMSGEGIRKWRDGLIAGELEYPSRVQIAAYRSKAEGKTWTVEDVDRWLQGGEVQNPLPKPEDLVSWANLAPIPDVTEQLAYIAAIVSHRIKKSMSASINPDRTEFRRMFVAAAEKEGSVQAISRKLKLSPGVCQAFFDGVRLPTPAEIEKFFGRRDLFVKPDGIPYKDLELQGFSYPPFPSDQGNVGDDRTPRTNGAHH